jgi:hypothetical protein
MVDPAGAVVPIGPWDDIRAAQRIRPLDEGLGPLEAGVAP